MPFAAVQVGEKWGFINRQGNLVIATQFAEAENFSEGRAKVSEGDKYGYIDETGKIVIPIQYEHKRPLEGLMFNHDGDGDAFHCGMARIEQTDRTTKYGFINKDGAEVVKPQYVDAGEFSEGLAYVLIDYKYGYIDDKGKVAIKPQFDRASDFKEGLACVVQNGVHSYIDRTGNVVLKTDFKWCSDFSEGLAQFKAPG